MPRKTGKPRGVHSFDCGNAVKNRLGIENVKIGIRGRAGNWISRIGMPMKENPPAVISSKSIVDAIGCECGRQRQESSGQTLGDAHEIRDYTSELASKHPRGAAQIS